MAITEQFAREVCSHITYQPGWFLTVRAREGRPYLQWAFRGQDSVTLEPGMFAGRKWDLSAHMTVSEVVGTAFKALFTALEHEARENFRYRKQAVFGPHLNVEWMALVLEQGDDPAVDIRPRIELAPGMTVVL